MRLRQIAVIVFVALLVAAGWWVMSDAIRALNVPPPPTEPRFEESEPVEGPPLLAEPPGMAERRGFWLRMLTTGDQRDVYWGITQLRADGDEGRRAVLEAAQRSIRSNRALVQQCLEFLLADPRPDCFPLARDALESDDPDAVERALLILARLGPPSAAVVPRLGELAIDREYPIPQHAMTALAAIGTDEAEAAAKDAVTRMEPGQRAFGYVALAAMNRPGVHDFLVQSFENETETRTRLAAAEGVVRIGGEEATPWLRDELAKASLGSPHFESVLRVLALAADDAALAVLVRRAEDTLESGFRRAQALETLRPFPFPSIRSTLERCSRAGVPVDARVEAWHQRATKDGPSAYRDLLAMLVVPGAETAEDRRVAALVLGRLRRPDAVADLQQALARLAPNENEERSLYLRAICLTGSPAGAETIARAVAADRSGFGTGGTAFDVYGVLSELTPELRSALGDEIRRALAGEFGEVGGNGLQVLILAVPTCCGSDAAPLVERYVHHEEREIREAAISALAFAGRPRSVDVLVRAWNRRQDALVRNMLRDTIEKLQYVAPR